MDFKKDNIIVIDQCKSIIDQVTNEYKLQVSKKNELRKKFIEKLNNTEFVKYEKVKPKKNKGDDQNEVNFINNENIKRTGSEERHVKEITDDLNDFFGYGFEIEGGFVRINCGSSKLDVGFGSIIELISPSHDIYEEIKELNAYEKKVKHMEEFEKLLGFYNLSTHQFFEERNVGIEVHLVNNNKFGFEITSINNEILSIEEMTNV